MAVPNHIFRADIRPYLSSAENMESNHVPQIAHVAAKKLAMKPIHYVLERVRKK